MSTKNFKIVVVGGGPVGLTAAHALEKAAIDFLLLERRPAAVIDAGSNLVLSPLGLRVLSQLGLGHSLTAVSSPLGRLERLDHRGRDIGDSQIFTRIEQNSGFPLRVISRHDLTKVLYESLPFEAQQKVLCNKNMSNIARTTEGVTVTCADGSSYTANAVIGADGAHSAVRDIVRTAALQVDSRCVNSEKPFLTTYRCLWIRFPKLPELAVGTTSETHGRGATTQLFVGEDSGVIALYERLDQPTKERLRHSQADQDSCVERWGHLPVLPSSKLTVRDLYTSRREAGLVSLEEGIVEHWSWDGRIVLAGDAAHKFTPSTGAGCNNGMIDIIALVNELHALLKALRTTPSSAQLALAFRSYQDKRQPTVESECAKSSRATSTATWETELKKFLDLHILSLHVVQRLLVSSGAKPGGPALDFISNPSGTAIAAA